MTADRLKLALLTLPLLAPSFANLQAQERMNFAPDMHTQCMAATANTVISTVPTEDQLAEALRVARLDFSENLNYLVVDPTSDQLLSLKQSLSPTERGSTRSQFKAQIPKARTYQLSQRVFLEPGFDWGGRNEGGKLGFGLAGGSAPTGGTVANDGFSARFMWRGNHDGSARLVLYSYAADRDQNRPYGDDHPLENVTAPTGTWFKVAFELTTNSRAGLADGSLRAWFDGVPALAMDNIQWQSAGSDIGIDALTYSTFYGGSDSSWSPERATYIKYADVCWSTPDQKKLDAD